MCGIWESARRRERGDIEGSERRSDKKPVSSTWQVDTKFFDCRTIYIYIFSPPPSPPPFIFSQTGNLSIRHMRTPLHYNCRQLGAVQAEWTWMCRCQLNPRRLEDLIIHGNHALSPHWMLSTQPWWFFPLSLPPPHTHTLTHPLSLSSSFFPLSSGGFIDDLLCRYAPYLKYHLLLQLEFEKKKGGKKKPPWLAPTRVRDGPSSGDEDCWMRSCWFFSFLFHFR